MQAAICKLDCAACILHGFRKIITRRNVQFCNFSIDGSVFRTGPEFSIFPLYFIQLATRQTPHFPRLIFNNCQTFTLTKYSEMSQTQTRSRFSQSQSLSQTQPTQAEIPQKVVDTCVKIMLARSNSKLPIRRQDLSQQLLSLNPTFVTKRFNAVIELARNALKKIYGYDIKEVGVKTNQQYILILSEPVPEAMIDFYPVEKDNVIIMAALSHIFMSGGSVTEDNLIEFMKNTNLIESKNDDITPDVKHFLKLFTRQLYLKFIKSEEFGMEKYTYEWGDRAECELTKMDLLKKVSTALDKDPDYWFEQFKMAEEDENNRSERN